jgi:hypothetical protein
MRSMAQRGTPVISRRNRTIESKTPRPASMPCSTTFSSATKVLHVPAFLRVPLPESGSAMFGSPNRQPGFLPKIDEAFLDIRPVERAAVAHGGAQRIGLGGDGAERHLGSFCWRVLPLRHPLGTRASVTGVCGAVHRDRCSLLVVLRASQREFS